jgi:hypothetical protein
MSIDIKLPGRRALIRTALTTGTGVLAGVAALGLGFGPVSGAGAAPTRPAAPTAPPISFSFVPSSPAVKACVPNLRANVTIDPNRQNDVLHITITGAPKDADFALFVLQDAAKPFGVAWYQSDIQTNGQGHGVATVEGEFNDSTFSVSLGGTAATFKPTHQFNLGLWFNNPATPFNLGCEKGATAPIVTPFNSDQHAGIQALNTANFKNKGPLFNEKE